MVQEIEKWQSNGRTGHGAIDLGEAGLRRKRDTEWILKLRTVSIWSKLKDGYM